MLKEELIRLLDKYDWFVQKVAREEKISRNALMYWMRKYNIETKRKLGEKSTAELIKYPNDSRIKKAYSIWSHIKKRCLNNKSKNYEYYGGRGIKMHKEWEQSFNTFFEDCMNLENAFRNDFTIDRINNNKGYFPNNVRFVTHKKNCNNRRNTRFYTYKGMTKSLTEWAETKNFKFEFLRDRIDKLGWTFEKAYETPIIKNKNIGGGGAR